MRYFVGHGIDIGSGSDPLMLYQAQFPCMQSCRSWDVEDGDAQYLSGIDDASFDFVHSSHCLEHVTHPVIALQNWWRVLKPGGHLVIVVPDEDLYEQGVWPSTFNPDHKHSFTIWKPESWSPVSRNLTDLLRFPDGRTISLNLLDYGQRPMVNRCDQTISMVAECAIEAVVKKC